jgi:hypothetical protein
MLIVSNAAYLLAKAILKCGAMYHCCYEQCDAMSELLSGAADCPVALGGDRNDWLICASNNFAITLEEWFEKQTKVRLAYMIAYSPAFASAIEFDEEDLR